MKKKSISKAIKKAKLVGKRPRDKTGHFVSKAALAKRKWRQKRKTTTIPVVHPKDQTDILGLLKKEYTAMKEAQKKALLALAAAAMALSAAAQSLASETEDSTPAAEPAKPTPAKKPAAAPKPVEPPKEEPAKSEGLSPYERAVEAAKEYSQVYGRDGLVKVMAPYIPAGKKTMQDIPADKLEDFIKELKG